MSGAREQVQRLLALAPYLQARGGSVPLGTVAADFGVSPQQVRKDIKVLWFCGLPGPGNLVDIDLEALEDETDGQVRIFNAEFLPRPLRLSGSEAAALLVALRALREGSSREAREVIDRLLRKLGDATGGPAPAAVHLTREPADLRATRATLRSAIEADHQLHLDYYVPARDETTSRLVDPIAVLRREGRDYLDAWCHLAEDRRLFRLDRIDAAEELDTHREAADAEPRDLAEGIFRPGPAAHRAVLRLGPRARWVADYYPVTARREGPDDTLEIELAVEDPRWLRRLVLALAPDARVLEPPGWAAAVAADARAALELYRTGTGGPGG